MRNVFKGFQVGKMAVPKVHMEKINKSFSSYHSPHPRSPSFGTLSRKAPAGLKVPKRPGHTKGIT